MKKVTGFLTLLLIAGQSLAGGPIEVFTITDRTSQPNALDVDVVTIFWDQRCVNVNFTVDDVPANAGTAAEIPATRLRQEFQASFNRWNEIPTSYINMNVTSIKKLNNGLPKMDFINELTFETEPGAGFLAASAPYALDADVTIATGDDLDADGDSDVFDPQRAGRNSCFDIDNDGDIEFPAGFYKAGTIMENDVIFNPAFTWSTVPTADRSVDIQAVATHEFGHSLGLIHAGINQISSTDGNGATMYPFIDIDDLASEVGARDLHTDDITWASFIYPEGTARSGPAALQRGDRPFAAEFGFINGKITQADGIGVLGASVQASTVGERETLVEAFSGKFVAFLLSDGSLVVGPESIVNGNYSIPVPRGLYDISIEAFDGAPVTADAISQLTPIVGSILGQNGFPEESRLFGRFEDSTEKFPTASAPVLALPGITRKGIDLVTNNELRLRNAGLRNAGGLGGLEQLRDLSYAERFTNAEVLALIDSGALLTQALFETNVADASVVPRYKRAGVFTGRISPDGTAAIDLKTPLLARDNFIGQQTDLTPVYAATPTRLTATLKQRLLADPTLDVFLVLETNNEFESGSSGRPPLLAFQIPPAGGLRNRSYITFDGQPFFLQPFNWSIEMRFLPPANNVFVGR